MEATTRTSPARLLVVDDRPDNLFVIESVLRESIPNLEIVTAGNATDGLKLAKKVHPAGALIDVQMPGMDGIEMCRRLKAEPSTQLISCLLLTSHRTTSELRATALNAGADDFVQRPFDNVEFAARVRVMLRLKEAEERLHSLNRDLERKVAERTAEIAESRTYLESVLESMMESLIAVSLSGNIERVNKATLDLLDYEMEELIGQPFETVLSHDVRSQMVDGPLLGEHDTCYRRKDSSRIPVRFCGVVRHTKDGTPMGRVCVARDVTRQLELEEQLRMSQKMEAVGRLAGGIAHDFNNLLTVILSTAKMMARAPELTDQARTDIADIVDASERAEALTGQLLAFSRRQVIQLEPVDVNDIVMELLPMLSRLVGEDIELITRLESEGSIKADRGQLQQIVMNLVVNARDALPRGGSIIIATRTVERLSERTVESLRTSMSPVGPYVTLTVQDDGCGMDSSTVDKIFEPFFTTKASGKGTGLGLAMVHNTVVSLGGSIAVESLPEWGTVVTTHFPLIQEELAAFAKARDKANDAESVATPIAGATILVVEDDRPIRDLVRRILEEQDCTLLVADDLAAAREMLACHEEPVDLLLTDVVLRRASGGDVAKVVKEAWPDAKILYMSGYTNTKVVQAGLDALEVSFIQKPFTPEALIRKIAEVLRSESG